MKSVLSRHYRLLFVLALADPVVLQAQSRVRLPGDVGTAGVVGSPIPAGPVWTPIPPGASLTSQLQPFDPYAATAPLAPLAPPGVLLNPPAAAPLGAPAAPWSFPQPTLPLPPTPTWPGGSVLPPANVPPTLAPTFTPVAPPGFGTTAPSPYFGPTPTPGPVPIFPDGLSTSQPERLFQDTGAVYTWLAGDGGEQLQINEVEIFTTLRLKRFASNTSGLRLMPGFIFDFLSGPQNTSADLPPQLYSAYLDTAWKPRLTNHTSADLSVRVGVYSDFDTVTNDSIRITGVGLGVVQLSPTMAVKLGVEYLDRVDIKILPAGGVLWEPNPQTRFDIYFPRPRLSRYWKTFGNTDVWWLVGGEYGLSSWTIDRRSPPLLDMSDQIDINDIRIFAGFDWDRLNGLDGVFEVGYVFDREVVFRQVPSDSTGLSDTVMLRLGLQF